MKKKTDVKKNMRAMLAVFCCLFVLLGSYLLYSTVAYGDQWFTTPFNPRIASKNNVADAGSIYDRNGVVLAYSEGDTRKYAESEDMRRSVSHIVGDIYGRTLGAETYFAKYLYGYDQNIADKFASVQSGKKGGDVYLTIDANLNEYIYDNMDKDGAVVLMNYKTGEILASVSKPTFDPYTVKEDTDESGSKFVNRVTQGLYPPGSTMKIVTTAAAIENGVTDLEIDCTGSAIIEGQKVTCPKEGGHGHVNLASAFEKSCNIYFGELAVKVGDDAMLKTADEFGFNYNFKFPDFRLNNSVFEVSGNKGDLAWAGIGQYHDLLTPMHNMMISAGIANGGVMMQPNTLLDVRYGGNSAYTYTPTQFRTVASASVASTIEEYMRQTVASGTATKADVSGVTVCGKTGTAEYVNQDTGETDNHSWFVGFVEDANHPLAIAVLGEGAGFGSAYATPLAGQILSEAIDLGY
ncbi:MAG: penicillin-binding protein 2 [Christensenella sp.]|uniref:peptidoglycan D,D-transpeptidase FtsI family protein n=1 Tax=Christensenella sp. TaxID=1935934 RepID=UPI002B221688|nr:penicillin-binding protein 2 [Christensenella sp.]MEA5002312.1 penicillin-binding protein 2 [Christensenella sp.]